MCFLTLNYVLLKDEYEWLWSAFEPNVFESKYNSSCSQCDRFDTFVPLPLLGWCMHRWWPAASFSFSPTIASMWQYQHSKLVEFFECRVGKSNFIWWLIALPLLTDSRHTTCVIQWYRTRYKNGWFWFTGDLWWRWRWWAGWGWRRRRNWFQRLWLLLVLPKSYTQSLIKWRKCWSGLRLPLY